MINKLPHIKAFLHIFGIAAIVIITAISPGCGLFQKMLTSMDMHPELVKRSEEFPGSHKCGDCHIDIYKEWSESTHSKSYINEEFRVATNNYEFEFCIRCHAPETVFLPLKK
ncbi:MAG: putative heme protein, partial [Candidatus Scalindua brodae]